MIQVAVGLGTNLGDRVHQLRSAYARLSDGVLQDVELSEIYETPPWGFTDQPNFLNAVAVGTTQLAPRELFLELKRLERELGRVESFRYGPRAIDLDLLIYEGVTLDTTDLTLPHRGIAERSFVLVPLHEVWPEWQHPHCGRTPAQMLADLVAKTGRLDASVFSTLPLDKASR